MSVKFSVTPRINPRKPGEARKYYPIAVSNGEISLKLLSRRVASMSALNTGDVLAVLDLLIQVIREELGEGRIVRLGDFGAFGTTLSGLGKEKAENVTAADITKSRLQFKPGKELRDMLATLQYEKK